MTIDGAVIAAISTSCPLPLDWEFATDRMKNFDSEMPFDGKRMVYGGFDPLVVRSVD